MSLPAKSRNLSLGPDNAGSVFEWTLESNGKWTQTVLHNFDKRDGDLPEIKKWR